MDYAMPRADDLPSLDLGFIGTRCTTNPLGVKGCGKAGAQTEGKYSSLWMIGGSRDYSRG